MKKDCNFLENDSYLICRLTFRIGNTARQIGYRFYNQTPEEAFFCILMQSGWKQFIGMPRKVFNTFEPITRYETAFIFLRFDEAKCLASSANRNKQPTWLCLLREERACLRIYPPSFARSLATAPLHELKIHATTFQETNSPSHIAIELRIFLLHYSEYSPQIQGSTLHFLPPPLRFKVLVILHKTEETEN